MPALNGSTSPLPCGSPHGILVVLLLGGVALSLVGFFITRDVNRRQVEAQFNAAARERVESVIHGFERGFEDVTLLRNFFDATDDVSNQDFDAFVDPILTRHPYIQAFQWLPEVTPKNRAALEAEARRTHPGFRFFSRDGAGHDVDMAPGAVFHAVFFVAPFRGNEVTLGYAAEGLPTRQETLARAIRMDALAASGRVRLIQETGGQAGVLVMIPVRGKGGRPRGVAQGVFRMGDLVQKSLAFLEPKGVLLRLSDASAPESEALLHEEPSPLPVIGVSKDQGLRLVRTFELAGRTWTVTATPTGGQFDLGTPGRAWGVLLAGLAFSVAAGRVFEGPAGQPGGDPYSGRGPHP